MTTQIPGNNGCRVSSRSICLRVKKPPVGSSDGWFSTLLGNSWALGRDFSGWMGESGAFSRQGLQKASGKSSHFPQKHFLTWRGEPSFSYSSVSSSACQSLLFASLGIRLVVTKSACLCFPLCGKQRPLPCSSSPHRGFRPAGGPEMATGGGDVHSYSSVSSSACQRFIFASLGIRQSPRGDMATVPTLGPSGRQLRLNCWLKKRR